MSNIVLIVQLDFIKYDGNAMTLYLIVKSIHLIGICLMLGATACNGLLHFQAKNNTPAQHRHVTLKNIAQSNKIIMGPAFLLLISSGLTLVYLTGIALSTLWLKLSLMLTAVLLLAFVCGHRIESKLEQVTIRTPQNQKHYLQLLSFAIPIGAGATLLSVLVLYLMVFKPT